MFKLEELLAELLDEVVVVGDGVSSVGLALLDVESEDDALEELSVAVTL